MQKLQLSFKILSEIPRKLSNTNLLLESHLCKNFVLSLTERNPKQLFNSSLTQPRPFSHFCYNSSRSWRSHHSVSERFSGFLVNPVLLKQLVSNTHLKNRSRSAFDRGALFLKTLFRTRHSEFSPTFNSSSRRWRSWFATEDNMVLGLISANVAVFILWRIADPTFMRKNFMISVENFTSGRVHTLITSAFSHIEVDHLFSNMIGLYFFGTGIGRYFGPEFVLKLYLAGAVSGSIFYLVHHAFMASSSQGRGNRYVDPKRIPGLQVAGRRSTTTTSTTTTSTCPCTGAHPWRLESATFYAQRSDTILKQLFTLKPIGIREGRNKLCLSAGQQRQRRRQQQRLQQLVCM